MVSSRCSISVGVCREVCGSAARLAAADSFVFPLGHELSGRSSRAPGAPHWEWDRQSRTALTAVGRINHGSLGLCASYSNVTFVRVLAIALTKVSELPKLF